jgi:DNA adenine methylase
LVNSIISTVGGKFGMRDVIVNNIIRNHTCFVEVFCGAAHVTLYKEPSDVEIINDLDFGIYSLFAVLRDNPDDLLYKIQCTPYSRKLFYELKNSNPTSDLDRAYRFYIMNRLCFGGKRPDVATFGYGFRVKRPPSWDKIEDFLPVIERLKKVYIENLDFRMIIDKYDSEDTIFYIDSPYVGEEHHYYGIYRFDMHDHYDLFEKVSNIQGKCLLSYNDNPIIRDMYKKYNIKEISRYNNIDKTIDDNREIAKELLIANYEFPTDNLPLFKGVDSL